MRYRDCENCQSEIDVREVVETCPHCKKNINKPKTKEMKATLENFLVKWDGNNPLWKEFIEWLNKSQKHELDIEGSGRKLHYGKYKSKCVALFEHEYGFDKSIVITLEQWQQLLNPKTETMSNFKKGDKVFVYPYGWCEVDEYEDIAKDMILVKQGCNCYAVPYHYVSCTEYTLDGFTQERPFTPKVGEYYYFWNDETINDDCVGYGRLKQISNNINFPYFFGTKYFQFCSETNPLL